MRTNRKEVGQSTDTVRAYLNEMGRVQLLTHEQEIQYARQVQQLIHLQSLKQALSDELGVKPNNADWGEVAGLDIKELERQLHLGQRAKSKMIEANLRLVVSIAKKYQNRGLELMDLIQEGALGLNRAAEKFDPARGYKFSTYATWWIRQAIARGLVDKGRLIRIPVHRCDKMGHYKKAYRNLTQELGRSPTLQEWADAVGDSVQGLRELVVQFSTPASLDQPVGESEEATLLELWESPGNREDFAKLLEQRDEVNILMERLNPRQQYVLSERYGLIDGGESTLTMIGAKLKLSRERVRQIHEKALQSLSELSEAEQCTPW